MLLALVNFGSLGFWTYHFERDIVDGLIFGPIVQILLQEALRVGGFVGRWKQNVACTRRGAGGQFGCSAVCGVLLSSSGARENPLY